MKLCLGTVQFGLNYGIQGKGQPEKQSVDEILSFAIDHGIEMFDTAASYGKAEEILGNYIHENLENASRMHIISKLKPNAFSGFEESEWINVAVKNAEDSLRQLGIYKFEAYLFHNATYIFNGLAVEALSKVISAGLTNRIGVSVYSPKEAMKALEYPVIGAIQVPYNVFDRRLDKCGFFEKAKTQDVVVYARSSLLQGLALMDPDNLPKKVSFARPYLEAYLSICRKFSISPLEAAIRYVEGKKGIDYVVFGIDNLKQLKEYVTIKDAKLSEEIINEINNRFDMVEERLVNPSLWK